MRLNKNHKKVLFIPFVIILLFYFGFGIETGRSTPKHAIVLVDHEEKTYFAPPCLSEKEIRQYAKTTVAVARANGLRPDNNCRNSGAFQQPGRSLSGKLLVKLGVLAPLPSRWNEDGTWSW